MVPGYLPLRGRIVPYIQLVAHRDRNLESYQAISFLDHNYKIPDIICPSSSLNILH